MPSGRIDQTIYVGPFQNIEQMNAATLYKPGELGSQVQLGGKAYQLIQVDSGATAAVSAAGHVPQAGDLAFWRAKTKYLVTNNRNDAFIAPGGGGGATNSRNAYAGVFCSITGGRRHQLHHPGNYGVIQRRGPHPGSLPQPQPCPTGCPCVQLQRHRAGRMNIALAARPSARLSASQPPPTVPSP